MSLVLLISFLTSCTVLGSEDDLTKPSQQAVSHSTVECDWTFDKLIEESDCCIIISKFKKINEDSPELSRGGSRKVGNEFQMGVTLIEYTKDDLCNLPAVITILEGETPFWKSLKVIT